MLVGPDTIKINDTHFLSEQEQLNAYNFTLKDCGNLTQNKSAPTLEEGEGV